MVITPLLEEAVEKIVDNPIFRAQVLSSPREALSLWKLAIPEQIMAQTVAWLLGYPMFREARAPEIDLVLRLATLERHPQGAIVIRQGEIGDKFYIIASGEVAVLIHDPSGRERHVATLGRGSHFGELALMYDIPRTATVQAHSAVELLALKREDFQELLSAQMSLAANIEQEARRRLSA